MPNVPGARPIAKIHGLANCMKKAWPNEYINSIIQLIRHFRPRQVFISGGEPLLYPEIADFLNDIKDAVEQINLFTSYQFSETARERISFQAMPLDQILFCHTPIFFDRQRWHEFTGGFPFDLYVKNIQAIGQMAVQKRFKFIINHESLVEGNP